MKIAILGFGREGKSVLKFLKKSLQYKNAKIFILDKKLGKNYLNNLNQFDVVFRSPGVPYNLPQIQNAIKKGIKFSSATDLFFQNAKKIGCKIIGITGTKGKGTASTLLYKLLKAAKKDVFLAGNIGKPAIEIIPKLKKNSIAILELSSFQLQDLKYSPDIAVVLDIFEDHLDSHKNFKEYFNAKANIAKWQNKRDKIFYFSDNKYAAEIAQKSKCAKIPIDSRHSHIFTDLHYALKIPGEHNFKNVVMVYTIAKNLGISEKIIKNVIKNFKGLEHRLEFIRKIDNIKFYNDSASTNPYTTVAAIKSFKEMKILIAGGKDKNLNYSPLAEILKNSNTKLIILFGENKKKIKQQILSRKYQVLSNEYKVILVKDLKSAINLAYQKAKIFNTKYLLPITILFSPASASFDMFKDYQDRGKKFKEIVKKLK